MKGSTVFSGRSQAKMAKQLALNKKGREAIKKQPKGKK